MLLIRRKMPIEMRSLETQCVRNELKKRRENALQEVSAKINIVGNTVSAIGADRCLY